MTTKVLKVALYAVFVIATSCLLTIMVLLGPPLTYFYFSSSTNGCPTVQAGVTRQDVLKIVDSSGTPYAEYSEPPDRFIFRGPHCACTVNFDQSGKVLGTEITPSGYNEFLMEAVEGPYY